MKKESLHISRLQTGDVHSFEELYNLWSGRLYNFVMRISRRDSYLAEEIVQSVFVKVWENRESIDPEKSFGGYLCTIAKNLLINFYQHKMLEYAYQEKVSNSDFWENTTEEDTDYHLLDEYINSLIELLPPVRRKIFIMSRRKLLTNKEISEELNLSEKTVEAQMTKAISFLRSEIGKHYETFVFAVFFFSIPD